jgi:hypothetical protein
MKSYLAVQKAQHNLAAGIFRDSAIATGIFILVIILLV